MMPLGGFPYPSEHNPCHPLASMALLSLLSHSLLLVLSSVISKKALAAWLLESLGFFMNLGHGC